MMHMRNLSLGFTSFCLLLLAAFSCDDGGGAAATDDVVVEVATPDLMETVEPDMESQGNLETAPDLSGSWVLVQIYSSKSNIPFVGETTQTTTAVLLVDLTQEDDQLDFTAEVCALGISSESTLVKTVLPDALVNAIPIASRKATMQREGGEWRYVEPAFSEVWGATLDNVENDPLPTSGDDPEVVDLDQDGNPGVTVRVAGLISGEIYVVQRRTTALAGTVQPGGWVHGLNEWSIEQVTLGSDNPTLEANQPEEYVNPDAEASHFCLVRLPADSNCESVLADAQALMESVGATCAIQLD